MQLSNNFENQFKVVDTIAGHIHSLEDNGHLYQEVTVRVLLYKLFQFCDTLNDNELALLNQVLHI